MLTRLQALLDSPTFAPHSLEEGPWKKDFAEMITLTHELLTRAQQQGHRIDFREGVGVAGKVQDITALVEWMHKCLPDVSAELPGDIPGNRLNRYFDAGTGYFSNGSFFTVDHDEELGFFIDNQRIYLNKHLKRVAIELKYFFDSSDHHLTSSLPKSKEHHQNWRLFSPPVNPKA